MNTLRATPLKHAPCSTKMRLVQSRNMPRAELITPRARLKIRAHGPWTCPVLPIRAHWRTNTALPHGPWKLTRAALKGERLSCTVRAPDPCSLYLRVDQASDGPCCFPLTTSCYSAHSRTSVLNPGVQMLFFWKSFTPFLLQISHSNPSWRLIKPCSQITAQSCFS